jgi:hypothetical protein
VLFHQGERESLYLADIARRVILVVLFDNRTTLGLVRLRVKRRCEELTALFEGCSRAADATDARGARLPRRRRRRDRPLFGSVTRNGRCR